MRKINEELIIIDEDKYINIIDDDEMDIAMQDDEPHTPEEPGPEINTDDSQDKT